MKEFFAASPALAWSLVGIMLALVVISLLWAKVVWWWHNTWYSFPFIGKIARLSRKIELDSNESWYASEALLCHDYKKFIGIQDETDYKEKATYITKAGDGGRMSTPNLIWVLTVALVFVEAMGFSYVLAGYALPGASENLQQTGALGMAFLISVILVGFTHFAGHELYVSGKIKNARQKRVDQDEDAGHGRKRRPTKSDNVDLVTPQSIDNQQPGYVQLMNRVGDQPGYIISIITAILVISVAIGATYVRGKVLEKQIQQQTTAQKSESSPAKDGLDMAAKSTDQAFKLPREDATENRLAVEKAIDDDANIDRQGGWGTFIVLALIFVFLQILSVLFGYRWGFAGTHSAKAHKAIGSGRFATYADVQHHYKGIMDTAQSKLKELQQKLRQRDGHSGTGRGATSTKTFYDFWNEDQLSDAKKRLVARKKASDDRIAIATEAFEEKQKIEQITAQSRSTENHLTPPPERISPTIPTAPLVADAIAMAPLVALDSALEKLAAMGDDKEAKRTYIDSLPVALNDQIKQVLKARKEAILQKAKQRDAELDDLL